MLIQLSFLSSLLGEQPIWEKDKSEFKTRASQTFYVIHPF